MLGPPTTNRASGPDANRHQAGSASHRWRNVAIVCLFVILGAVVRQFVSHDPATDGDAFNEVIGISDADAGVTGVGVGPGESVFVRDDEATRVKDPRSAGMRNPVDAAGSDAIPVLEVRVFLGLKPLTEGNVVFFHENPEKPGQQLPVRQGAILDGTNVAKVPMPRLRGMEGQVQIAAGYEEKKPGCSPHHWMFEARIPLPRPGQRWIGPDIVLKQGESHFICSGKVVDQAGQPIPGSTVASASSPQFKPDLFTGIGPGQYVLGGLATARDGSFELWDQYPSRKNELFLRAKATGHALRGPFRFRRGAKGLRVVMYPAGSVSGSLILPTGMDRSWIRVGLLQDKGGGVVSHITFKSRGSRGEWTLDPVAPGRYTLRIAYLTMDQPIVEFHGIEVRAGQECRDVRIQSLDLRGLLRVIRVRVVPERPKGPLQCTVLCRASDGAKDRRGRSIRLESSGTASLVIPAAGAHLSVEAKGYEPIVRPRVTNDTIIEIERLKALPRVEIWLVGGFPKKLPARIWMELVPAAGSGPGLAAKSFTLEGSFCFPEVRPGPYKARIYLKAERDKDAPRMFPDRDQVLQVRSTDDRQQWTVAFDHGRLLRFAEEGKQRMKAPRKRR